VPHVHKSIGWVPSLFDPARKVARPTLAAIERLLKARPTAARPTRSPAERTVLLTGVPGLSEVGGIACVNAEDASPVGIARVGRSSFVGYRLDTAGLTEVPIGFDERTGMLTIIQ